jgi:hypothetical protein
MAQAKDRWVLKWNIFHIKIIESTHLAFLWTHIAAHCFTFILNLLYDFC